MAVTVSQLAALAFVAGVLAGPAPVNSDSKRRAVARAHLDSGLVKGVIEFTVKDDNSVKVHLDTTGLPDGAGPFFYHINDGKCKDSKAVLNPYDSHYAVCDELASDADCAVGDLSGKHGYINTTCFETQYDDHYLSLNKANPACVVGKSVVVIDQNHNEIVCGDIKAARKAKMTAADGFAEEADAASVVLDASAERETSDIDSDSYTDHDFDTLLPQNGTVANSSWEDTEYDSGSNALIASGVVGVLAGGLALLI